MAEVDPKPSGPVSRLSALWARVELTLAAVLAVGVTALILLNVITRSMNNALFWVDEAAIYAMVWMTFLGASAAVHHRQQVAITLLTDALPAKAQRAAAKLVDALVFVFACGMVWFCWRWFMPLQILQTGFDAAAFQGATFNFIYAEPTSTIGIRKWIIWLVMPIFSAGLLLHSLAQLLDLRPPAPRSEAAT
ncbi:TRAP transporter small permease [Gymnodinialimonas sp. 2305UL16-5]|uniref:TRAP transporter small permease n=1 Tax=Gymnodinialimonas mytili TaxID=3126503 RepID=UPI00309A9D58